MSKQAEIDKTHGKINAFCFTTNGGCYRIKPEDFERLAEYLVTNEECPIRSKDGFEIHYTDGYNSGAKLEPIVYEEEK